MDLNATQACIRAGYSAKTANKSGPRLLVNVGIQQEIDRLKTKRIERIQLTSDKVLTDIEEIRQLAKEESQYSICLKASELQGKHLALFTERVAHEGEIKWPVVHINLEKSE